MRKTYYVYIIINLSKTLYIGVSNDLMRRTQEHKDKVVPGFTNKYNIDKLVYFETFDNIENALVREKQLKKWRRKKKINLIEKVNPGWEELIC